MAEVEEELLTYSRYNRGETNDLVSPTRKIKVPVPLLDEITMGPIDKYLKFNKFPWALILHILLLCSTFAQIMLIIDSIAIYFRSQQLVWRKIFGDEVPEANDNTNVYVGHIFSLDDLSDHIETSVNAYFELNQQYYTHIMEFDHLLDDYVPLPVKFEAFYLRGEDRDQFANFNSNFTQEYIGIWGEPPEKIADFLNKTTNFRLIYEVEHKLPTEQFFIHDCF